MTVTLGKRKRRVDIKQNQESSDDDENARALFQRAFEAKFRPLERKEERTVATVDEAESSDESESDWDGLSNAEDGAVEIIQLDTSTDRNEETDRAEMKAFMSSKPPSSRTQQNLSSQAPDTISKEEDDSMESQDLLKHDLALQRLLKESHLLDPTTTTTTTPTASNRLKALDLRLQDLGAKTSATAQEKMPLAHRKGMVAKAEGREASRRKEAKENGVVLERAQGKADRGGRGGSRGSVGRREKGMGGPTVGKFSGGTLRLSREDVRSIEGPRDRRGGGRGRGRGRGRGGKR